MGWASASNIMDAVIKGVKANVPDDNARREIYQPIYDALTQSDWDTVDECIGQDPVFDKIAAEDGWTEDGWDYDHD